MTTRMPAFQPTAVLEGGRSDIAGARFPSRRSTTDEQRREAIRHAAAWMAEQRIWTVELEVLWTRREPTVLTVVGHGERFSGRTVPVVDRWSEADADGRSIVLTTSERHAMLEAELGDIWAEGVD